MSSKYVDISAIVQVIGCCFNNVSLLDCKDKYNLSEYDFPDTFHKIVYGVIYKLYENGATSISISSINDYLESRPNAKAVYTTHRGDEWLLNASKSANSSTFDYYYNRTKKMTLLRAYDEYGVDMTWLFDIDNIFDAKKRQEQEDLLDNLSVSQLVEKIDKRIDEIKSKCSDSDETYGFQSGDGIDDLLEDLKKRPEVGIPMYGSLMNAITRGARLKKFYLLSAPSGYGNIGSKMLNI